VNEPVERLVRDPECGRRSGLSRTTRWKLEKQGRFPKRRRVAGRLCGWLESELVAWMHSRELGGADPPLAALAARGVVDSPGPSPVADSQAVRVGGRSSDAD